MNKVLVGLGIALTGVVSYWVGAISMAYEIGVVLTRNTEADQHAINELKKKSVILYNHSHPNAKIQEN